MPERHRRPDLRQLEGQVVRQPPNLPTRSTSASPNPTCDLAAINGVLKAFISAPNQKQFCVENFLNFKVLSTSLNIKTQLKQIIYTSKLAPDPQPDFLGLPANQRLKISFLAGYFQHVAHLQPNGTILRAVQRAELRPRPPLQRGRRPGRSSSMYIEYILTVKDYLRTVSEIDIGWLLELYPEMFRSSSLALMTDHSRNRIQTALKRRSSQPHPPNAKPNK